MIKVLIADDESLVRAGLRAVLESAAGIAVVAEAGDGRAAVAAARSTRPDVALLDIKMPVCDGLAAAAEIRRDVPAVRIVMLTSFGTQQNAQRAVLAGTAGFVLKSCAPADLIGAVRAAFAGQAYLSPQVTRYVLDMIPLADAASAVAADAAVVGVADAADAAVARERAAAARLAVLTPRESQVISLLAEGLPNGSIATRLRMTEASIKTYVSRILAKLGCANRVQAALLARDAGLVRDAGGS